VANEEIVLTIVRPEVGIEYHPSTSEAEFGDRRAAVDLALHALARHAIDLRQQQGMPVPEALEALVNSELWRDGL